MSDLLKIYIDRLRNGQTERFEGQAAPAILELEDPEVQALCPIDFSVKAYLSYNELIVDLMVKTYVTIPCALCNEKESICIEVRHHQEVIPISEIKGQIYDITQLLREAVILNLPSFIRCGKDHCKNLQTIEKYLSNKEKGGVQNPFVHL